VVLAVAVAVAIPGGAAALLLCVPFAAGFGLLLSRGAGEQQRTFLLKVFVGGLLVRMAVGVVINGLHLQEFFGGDALTYDWLGGHLLETWRGNVQMMPELKTWNVA